MSQPETRPFNEAPAASQLMLDTAGAAAATEAGRVYREILDAATDGRLLPGTRLTEARLCRVFSSSRSAVRMALVHLAHDRIVRNEPHRGAVVWEPGISEMRDIFDMRRILEAAVVERLVSHLAQSPDMGAGLASLHTMVERERAAFESGDRVSWNRLSNAFHVELARLLRNDELLRTLHSLCARTTLIIAYFDTPGDTACSYDEHAEILTLIREGRAVDARRAMCDHLTHCEQRLRRPENRRSDPWATFHLERRPLS